MSLVGTDFLTPTERSGLMRRVRSTNTAPERELAIALSAAGLSFEKNSPALPGKPDFVFRTARLAVFVDGEFWHGGQWRKRGLTNLSHQFPDETKCDRWTKKIRGNMVRDLVHTAKLLSMDWTVIRIWACEIERDVEASVALIKTTLTDQAISSPASAIPDRTVAEFFAG